MKRLNKHSLYTSLLLTAIILLCFGLYSRRSRRIEVQGELLSIQHGTAYFLNAAGFDLIVSALDLKTHKSREFIRLPAENVGRTNLRFHADFLYFFRGQRNTNGLSNEEIWKTGAIFRVPLTGGEPEQIVTNAHTSRFQIVPPMLYRLEPVLPLKKAPAQNTFQLLAAELQTPLKTKVIRQVPAHVRPGVYGKGLLWTEYDLKLQMTFLHLYEPSTSLSKRFGPYSMVFIPFQTRQEAFWVTRSKTADGLTLHCFDSKTQTETQTILSNDIIERGMTDMGMTYVGCGRKILLMYPQTLLGNSVVSGSGIPVTIEIFDYPFTQERHKLTDLSAYPRQIFLDDDNFYYVTEEVESDWMNFSSDNSLKAKSWLRWVEIPR